MDGDPPEAAALGLVEGGAGPAEQFRGRLIPLVLCDAGGESADGESRVPEQAPDLLRGAPRDQDSEGVSLDPAEDGVDGEEGCEIGREFAEGVVSGIRSEALVDEGELVDVEACEGEGYA
ncbi:hypothetical protein QN350_13510 [Cryobacterium sp. 10I5]|nr:hypothetical protein [Cryobacterium sp. 10I5]MEB0266864.1 hypothetical protein [Cryobacterium sp. 10I5]